MDRIHNLLNSIQESIWAKKAYDKTEKKEKQVVKSTKSYMENQDRFAIGDSVEDINTSCVHYGSQGIVEDLENLPNDMGQVVVYKTTNMGPTWNKDQILKKTPSQLVRSNIQMQQHREPSMIIDDQTNTNDIMSEDIDEKTVINNPVNINDPMEDAEVMEEMTEYQNEVIEMAMSSLRSVATKARGILDHMEKSSVKENLTEPWLLGKIAIIEDYMTTIHDFVMFSTEIDDTESEAGDRPGLWDNIRKKKEKEGKNYKPAKRGNPDRPSPEQWKKLTK
jgi:hypothetical protein